MDRVRAGLTGLGAVFLVTAAAALLFGPEPGDRAAVEQSKEPGEPLAQLGVAPSNEKADETAPTETPAPAATPSASERPIPEAQHPDDGPRPTAISRDLPVRI
jgi:hypothetical protein